MKFAAKTSATIFIYLASAGINSLSTVLIVIILRFTSGDRAVGEFEAINMSGLLLSMACSGGISTMLYSQPATVSDERQSRRLVRQLFCVSLLMTLALLPVGAGLVYLAAFKELRVVLGEPTILIVLMALIYPLHEIVVRQTRIANRPLGNLYFVCVRNLPAIFLMLGILVATNTVTLQDYVRISIFSIGAYFIHLLVIYPPLWSREESLDIFRKALPLTPAGILGWCQGQLDRAVIINMGTLEEVGAYGFASRLMQPVQVIGRSTLSPMLTPYLMKQALLHRKVSSFCRVLPLINRVMTGAFVVLTFVWFAFLMKTTSFQIPVTAALLIFMFLTNTAVTISDISNIYLWARQKRVFTVTLTFIAVLTSLILSVMLYPSLGIVGVAYSAFAAASFRVVAANLVIARLDSESEVSALPQDT